MKTASRFEAGLKLFGALFLGTSAVIAIACFIYFISKLDKVDHGPLTAAEANQLCQEFVQVECEFLSGKFQEDRSYVDYDLDRVYFMYFELSPFEQQNFLNQLAAANGEDPRDMIILDKYGTHVIVEKGRDLLENAVTSN